MTEIRKECYFWILGAGASIDSGLPTFRGPSGIYQCDTDTVINNAMSNIDTLEDLLVNIKNNKPGPTYHKIKDISPKGSFILTQNIDQYANITGLDTVDIHLRGNKINKENIVLLGENLPSEKVQKIYTLIKQNKPTHIIILGTSMQFPYLRTFIKKAKMKYASKVFHINPDENYKGNRIVKERYNSYLGRWTYNIGKCYKNEFWIKKTAIEGIEEFEKYIR